MVERSLCMREATGSTPVISIFSARALYIYMCKGEMLLPRLVVVEVTAVAFVIWFGPFLKVSSSAFPLLFMLVPSVERTKNLSKVCTLVTLH